MSDKEFASYSVSACCKLTEKFYSIDLFWVWCFFFFFSRPCDQLLTQSLDHALNENRPSLFWVAVVTGLLRIFAVFLSKWQRERKKEIPKICFGKEKSFGRLCEIILSTKKKLTSSSETGRLRTSEIPIKKRYTAHIVKILNSVYCSVF